MIAEELSKDHIEIFWITVNLKIKERLESKYGEKKVLHIQKNQEQSTPIDDFKINEIILSDRSLKEEKEKSKKYLNSIQLPIYKFIKENKICAIFGELTWAHEILTHRITEKKKDLNCKYLNPHTIRIPTGNFGFFLDEEQSILLENTTKQNNSSLTIKLEKPDYLKLNNIKLSKHFSITGRAKRILEKARKEKPDLNDPTIQKGGITWLKNTAKKEINREIYRLVNKHSLQSFARQNYVFYPLHKQPEASIDVIGRYYENQLSNIINIWRALPTDWKLVVKEHSNAIGDRSFSFYKKLLSYQDIYLASDEIDSHQIIINSQAVITVSGTAAYEAAIIGKPALTFSNAFFNNLNKCFRISIDDLKNTTIKDLIESKKERMPLGEFQDWLRARTFEGIISDPDSNPKCIEKTNIEKTANAFKKAITITCSPQKCD